MRRQRANNKKCRRNAKKPPSRVGLVTGILLIAFMAFVGAAVLGFILDKGGVGQFISAAVVLGAMARSGGC